MKNTYIFCVERKPFKTFINYITINYKKAKKVLSYNTFH